VKRALLRFQPESSCSISSVNLTKLERFGRTGIKSYMATAHHRTSGAGLLE